MSATETVSTVTTETPKARKVAKAKPKAAKKPVKQTAAPSDNGLGKSYLRTLGILAKAKGPMSRARVAAATIKLGIACFGGRISNESATYADLVKGGYVKEKTLDIDGKAETVYEVTGKGRKAAAK